MVFRNLQDAGQRLADVISKQYSSKQATILAYSKQGVPLGYEVAKKLGAPFDLLLVEPIFIPEKPSITLGAVTEGNLAFIEDHVQQLFQLDDDVVDNLVRTAEKKLQENYKRLRENRVLELEDRLVILVDDVLTSGTVPIAALEAVSQYDPAASILAIPACDYNASDELYRIYDSVICLIDKQEFHTPQLWYAEREEVTDKDIIAYLHLNRASFGYL